MRRQPSGCAVSPEPFVDENHKRHFNVPIEMGDEIEVIVRPEHQPGQETSISDDEQLLLAAFSAVTPENAGEDAIWGKYIDAGNRDTP